MLGQKQQRLGINVIGFGINMTKVEVCPLCGSKPRVDEITDSGFYRVTVRCLNCQLSTYCMEVDSMESAREIAIDTWNHRYEKSCKVKRFEDKGSYCEWGFNCGHESITKTRTPPAYCDVCGRKVFYYDS